MTPHPLTVRSPAADEQVGYVYEFKRLFPSRSQSVELTMENDQEALRFATMIVSSGRMEIWDGIRLVGAVEFQM